MTTSPPIHLGPFELLRPIAQGGMGEVWRAHHPRQGVDVAIKVVRHKTARDPRFLRLFQSEIAQVARLDHPGVVLVLDHGEVPPAAEAATEGRIVAGSPWLAMEFASAGTLDQAPPPTWQDTRETLSSVLSSIGHAHARGVVHLDIKPANILLGSPHDLRPGIKLTDFGLAQAWGEDEHAQVGGGTPRWMAPEQARGRRRDQGPWTDLYAVGCVGWWLATGTPPQISAGGGIPQFTPQISVPTGLDRWLERMLAADPARRFQYAADAWHALAALGDAQGPTLTTGATVAIFGDASSHTFYAFDEEGDTEPVPTVASPEPAPLAALHARYPPPPQDWRQELVDTPVRLVGAGLGIYGMRAAPLVGREPQRDALWQALLDVHARADVGAVVLRGAAGRGKTRLADWLAERALETGAAHVLRVAHDPMPGPAHGLRHALAKALRVVGLDAAQGSTRVHRTVAKLGAAGDYLGDALCRMLFPGAEEQNSQSSPAERRRVIARLLELMGGGRPTILLIEDAEWAAETLRFARYLLEGGWDRPLPILVLATCRESNLLDRPAETDAIDAIEAHAHGARVPLPGLQESEMRELIARLLVLDDRLARTVTRRADGSPVFATQLIGDWVQRGVLHVTDQGFTLAPGEEAVVPDDIHQLWQDRLDRALDGARPAALEAAAALGRSFDRTEWETACGHLDVPIDSALVARMTAARLLTPTELGWRWEHGLLQESVGRSAREAGRWARTHRACADMLSADARHRNRHERIGRHRVHAGQLSEALPPLLAGAKEAWRTSDYDIALELLDLHDGCAAETNQPPTSLAVCRNQATRAHVLLGSRQTEQAREAAAGCATAARRGGHWDCLSSAQRTRAEVARRGGDLILAEALAEHAHRIATEFCDPSQQASCLLILGAISRQLGDLKKSISQYGAAAAIFKSLDAVHERGLALQGIGGSYVVLGDSDSARIHLTQAIELFHATADTESETACLNDLGDALRIAGDLTRARSALVQAATLFRRLGSKMRVFPLVNVALVDLQTEQWTRSLPPLEEAAAICREAGREAILGFVAAVSLAAFAGTNNWTAFDEAHAEASNMLARTSMTDPDIGRFTRVAARLAAEAGQADRAAAATEIGLMYGGSGSDETQ